MNFQMFKLVLEKVEEPEIKLPTSIGSWKMQESFRKSSTSALLTSSQRPKTLTVWITTNCGKFWKRWECQTTWPASWEICMQVKKQKLELDVEQQTGSKSERSMSRLYIVTLLIWLICKMLGWMKHKLESRWLGEISRTSDIQMSPPLWQKGKKN